MLLAGVDKLCFVIGRGKSDIVEYFGYHVRSASVCYVVQDEPRGLCDALFRPLPFIGDDERVCFGLPDTIWFPVDGLLHVAQSPLEFLLFPVDRPELFDAVELDDAGNVLRIEVKTRGVRSRWVWGAFGSDGRTLRRLHALWCERDRQDEYLGTLVNAYLARGGAARGVQAGEKYVDVGTLNGYREAAHLLERHSSTGAIDVDVR
jgi:dTDP-glucose pyrophosphorylase